MDGFTEAKEPRTLQSPLRVGVVTLTGDTNAPVSGQFDIKESSLGEGVFVDRRIWGHAEVVNLFCNNSTVQDRVELLTRGPHIRGLGRVDIELREARVNGSVTFDLSPNGDKLSRTNILFWGDIDRSIDFSLRGCRSAKDLSLWLVGGPPDCALSRHLESEPAVSVVEMTPELRLFVKPLQEWPSAQSAHCNQGQRAALVLPDGGQLRVDVDERHVAVSVEFASQPRRSSSKH